MKRVLGLGVAAVLMMALAGCEQHQVKIGTTTPKIGPTVTTPAATKAAVVAVASDEIIVDDKDAAFTTDGKWNTAEGDYLKGSVHWATKAADATAKATWTPVIPSAGNYAVYEYHGENPSNDHASNAPFTINFDGGSKDVAVDLTSNIGKWNLMGTYKFAAGTKGNVTLTNKANDNVIADGVKFVKVK